MANIYDLDEGISSLKRYLEEQRKKGMLSKKSYEDLLKRIKQDTDAVDKDAAQLTKNAKKSRELKAAAKSFVSNSLRGAQAIRKNREDFRSLNPALKAATSAAQMTTSATGQIFKAVGDAASTFSIFGGPLVKAIGTIGGGALSVLGTAMDENAKKTATLANAFGQFALGELQNVVESYRTLGSVGAITAEGMSGVYNDAIRAGMGLKEYSQLMASEGKNLSNFAGSVTAGAKALGDVSQANEGYKREYLALGYTYAEQQKYTADYLKRNRVLQGTSIENTDKLAEGSREYMDLLDQISRLTGQSKDAAAKELEEQMSNVRFQAKMRIVSKRGPEGSKIAEQMTLVASGIKAFAGPGLAKGFMDLTGGLGTKASEDLVKATGGEGEQIKTMLENGEIDAGKALQMFQEAMRRSERNVGGDRFIATNANTKNALADILSERSRFTHAQDITVDNLNKIRKDQGEAKKANDQETKNVLSAQEAMRKMAIEFDKMVQDKVFPLATESVEMFTDLVVDFVNTAGKTLGFANKVVRKVRGKPEPKTLMQEGAENAGAFTEDEKTQKMVKPGEGLTGKSLTGVKPTLAGRIEQVAREYKTKTGKDINVTSAVRSPEEQAKLYENYISGRSKYPAAPPGRSKHDRGLAIDVDSRIANELDSMGLLAKYGLGRPVANDPVHIEVVSLATGGVVSGPKSGYPAVLHGDEAVVPLPNGTDIPVEPTGMSEMTEKQIKKIRQQNQIINELIIAARTNNAANNRLLSLKAS